MTKQVYWGIDIGKFAIDVSVESCGQELFAFKVENSPSKIRMAFSHYMRKLDLTWEDSTFCMENTGLYTSFLLRFLCSNSAVVYVVNPHHLQKSMGLARGKSDKIDARRIARFIAKNHDELHCYERPEEDILALKNLQTKRKMYLKQIKQLNDSSKHLKEFANHKSLNVVTRAESTIIKQLRKALKEVEIEINRIINANAELKSACKLISTVPGVGPVLKVALAIATNGFKRMMDPKKLGCYCGVVPFEHSSGTSIRGRSRLSPMADKYLKTILQMASMRAVRLDGDLKDYYLRKVGAGKNKMLVLNAVRNKIIGRVCAVLRHQREYQSNLVLS
jgi:transposase